jgi:RNA polymerase sigma-70 factor, ECF subfamily
VEKGLRRLKQAWNATCCSIETRTEVNKGLEGLDDKALINLALAGRAECFDALMHRHLRGVKRRISAMVANATEAEDVIQEVQLKAWMHLCSFRGDCSFRTWITQIATNEALQSHRRVRQRRQCDDVNLDGFTASGDSPFQSCARREMAAAVHNAIGSLPPKFRQILILRDLHELSISETARHLNTNAQLVKTRLFRARVLLSKVLRLYLKTPGVMPEMKTLRVPDWRTTIAA